MGTNLLNYKDHLTHWKGIPLAQLSRDECLDAMQELNKKFHNVLGSYQTLILKQGRSDVFHN